MNRKNEPEVSHEARKSQGARLSSPSTARNREAILEAFLVHMPHAGTILEIGSGTGEHAIHIAARLPYLRWLPGDPDSASRASIAAWIAHAGLTNVEAPHNLDVAAPEWTRSIDRQIDAIVSINMIHIAPFAAAEGLIAGARALLEAGGKLFLYGPFARDGEHTAPSNSAFDANLKSRDRRWGVRDLERDIVPLAEKAGLSLEAIVPMPANNLSVIFARR